MWRRNGVLSATCDLNGIKSFPFDTSFCALEFGGTRNPLFHRVNYNPRPVEYSEKVKNKVLNIQEYQLDTSLSKQTNRTEKLTGFSNGMWCGFKRNNSRQLPWESHACIFLLLHFTLQRVTIAIFTEIIRYEFAFVRARKYYVNMFVLLYIVFTLLSFGMFFVDYRLGERLGYGTLKNMDSKPLRCCSRAKS